MNGTPGSIADTVLVSVTDGVAWVELNRPLHGNAIDLDVARQLDHAFRCLTDRDDVAVAVLAGVGDRFCVGGDIRAMAAAPDPGEYLSELATAAHAALLALRALPMPVVAAVQGACAGAGLGYALACDVVLAEPDARFLAAYAAVGLSPDCGLSWLLPRIIGPARAVELLLTNRTLTAAEAIELGLVTRLVEPGSIRTAATNVAGELVSGPRSALSASVQLLRASYGRSLAEQLDYEAASIAAAADSAYGREGVAAFMARRSPNFIQHS